MTLAQPQCGLDEITPPFDVANASSPDPFGDLHCPYERAAGCVGLLASFGIVIAVLLGLVKADRKATGDTTVHIEISETQRLVLHGREAAP